VGDLLELLCAAAFACHVLATNWATHRHPVGVLLTVQFALGGLVFLALAAGQGTLQPPRSGSVIVALLVTGVLASALAGERIAGERHMVGDGARSRRRIDELARHAWATIGDGAAGEAVAVQQGLECGRLVEVVEHHAAVNFDAGVTSGSYDGQMFWH
jgi:hypothetical protein